jgi:integrase/recombinase XerD
MNLQRLIEQYIVFQQSLGTAFETDAILLRAFGRALGSRVHIANIRPRQVEAFLDKTPPVTITWHTKFRRLRCFFQYAVSRGYLTVAPMPTTIPKRPPLFVPYIYTREELRRLFRVIDADQRKCKLEPTTMHTLILLLYAAGLRLREATNLIRTDVNLNDSLLTIRNTKFGKTRLVPFGTQLKQALTQYALRAKGVRANAPFFTTRLGAAVVPDTLQRNFRILCDLAGIRRTDGSQERPRLHDLRHNADSRIMPTHTTELHEAGESLGFPAV